VLALLEGKSTERLAAAVADGGTHNVVLAGDGRATRPNHTEVCTMKDARVKVLAAAVTVLVALFALTGCSSSSSTAPGGSAGTNGGRGMMGGSTGTNGTGGTGSTP
jgi:hypothetical protein